MAPPPVFDGERGARLIQLGVFGAPQGVRGEIRVKSFTQDPRDIGAYGMLTDEAGGRSFTLKVLRPLKDDMVVARVEGVATRDDAAALTHVGLFVRRAQLPPPVEGEFYHDDLVGLQAQLADGTPFGRVIGVLNYGAGDILEIAPADGGETNLLPFNATTAPLVDFAAGVIVVAPPVEVEGESSAPLRRGRGYLSSPAISASMLSGVSVGAWRATTWPSRPTTNLVKFHLIASVPRMPGAASLSTL